MAHGNSAQVKKLSWYVIRDYDVVLTTYGKLASEMKRLERHTEEEKARGNMLNQDVDTATMAKLFPFLGPRSKFYRVILDEAQCIKGKATNASRAACQLNAVTRFCLTGTPMMNNVGELYSLIKFLRIKPYNEWTAFSRVCTLAALDNICIANGL